MLRCPKPQKDSKYFTLWFYGKVHFAILVPFIHAPLSFRYLLGKLNVIQILM